MRQVNRILESYADANGVDVAEVSTASILPQLAKEVGVQLRAAQKYVKVLHS